jgi:hypothetical protein
MADGTGLWHEVLVRLIRGGHLVPASDLAALLSSAIQPLGIEVTSYLVDLEQQSLRALPEPGKPTPQPLPIEGSVGGRAFMTVTPLVASRSPGRLWLPLINGTERLGVLDVTLPDRLDPDSPHVRDGLDLVAGLVGHLVTAKTRYGDTLDRARRSRPMSVGAELLWQLLPPLTFATTEVVISAILEPCYDVGGDAFDYSVDDDIARIAVFDAVGHGLAAALTAAVALSATRTSRVQGQGLYATARAADLAVAEHFPEIRFATAVLADLDLKTGVVRYLNAGHPPPVLLRAGKVVATLDAGRRMPLGLDDPTIEIAETALEPGDRLLFYTDGFTEARDRNGDQFGLSRLVDFAERHSAAGLPAPETVRRLARTLLDHQHGASADDATLVMVSWSAISDRRSVV